MVGNSSLSPLLAAGCSLHVLCMDGETNKANLSSLTGSLFFFFITIEKASQSKKPYLKKKKAFIFTYNRESKWNVTRFQALPHRESLFFHFVLNSLAVMYARRPTTVSVVGCRWSNSFT